jgi:hypothetical protein
MLAAIWGTGSIEARHSIGSKGWLEVRGRTCTRSADEAFEGGRKAATVVVTTAPQSRLHRFERAGRAQGWGAH